MTNTSTRTGAPRGGLPTPPTPERVEGLVQVLILLVVGSMAGAASFTHVHDWTMTHSPEGTHDWFGWGNAVISELTPLAAGLEVRRRKRNAMPIGYPLAVLIAAACLSLAAQIAVAKPSPSGWLLSAIPALAFLALSKLVLGRTSAAAPATATTPATVAEPITVDEPTLTPAPSVAQGVTVTALPTQPPADLPTHLLSGARFAAINHRQTTGAPITADELAARMNVTPATAAELLDSLGETRRVNGTPVLGGEAR